MSSVAVVVPGYNRAEFTEDEEISFRHLEHYLGRYDKFIVVPQSLAIERPGFPFNDFQIRILEVPSPTRDSCSLRRSMTHSKRIGMY